jgi:ElaB/YqjD/DUF883 family membrane-anchored ribosome-binding protein
MNTSSQRTGAPQDPEQLERRADQIRADMDQTLDALERKLAPSQLLDKSLVYLRDHAGDVVRDVGDAVRRNPVPVLLAVAGIGWLVTSSLRRRDRASDSFDGTFGDESPYADEPPARFRNRFQQRVAAARARTRRAGHEVASTLEERPLLFGGLAVVIGALIGAVVPSTEYEDKIVGEVRDRAVERARQMGERQYQNLRSRLETHRDLEVSGHAH